MCHYIPIIIALCMILLLAISWKNVTSYHEEINAEYALHIQNAEKLEQKEIYIDAVKEYEAALSIRTNRLDLATKIMELYEKLEMDTKYMEACENSLKIDPSQKSIYLKLIDMNLERNNYREALKIASKAEKNIGADSDILSRVIMIKGRYNYTSYSYHFVKGLCYLDTKSPGFRVAEQDGKLALYKEGGGLVTEYDFDDIGLLSENVIPVKKMQEYYYIDNNGYRKLVPDEPAEYLGSFSSGLAPAKFNGKYGYVDKRMNPKHLEYDYAGVFSNGIAPVQKSGKWGIINTDFKNLTGFVFDEIVMNEYDVCSTYGVFFARVGNTYSLYDTNGRELAGGFENVEMFASTEPAAVKLNGKWGFLSTDGTTVIQPSYDEARSFCIGYAPVLIDGKWGCIDRAEHILIEPQFENMESFCKKGYAEVTENGEDKLIKVTIYDGA